MLTRIDITILERQEPKALAAWWCILNRMEWPPGLPNPDKALRGERRWAFMSWIWGRVGYKLCCRVWNQDTMTDEGFEDFWNQSTDPEAKKRYRAWLEDQVTFGKFINRTN